MSIAACVKVSLYRTVHSFLLTLTERNNSVGSREIMPGDSEHKSESDELLTLVEIVPGDGGSAAKRSARRRVDFVLVYEKDDVTADKREKRVSACSLCV